MQEMALDHYADQMHFDDEIRNSGHPAATAGFIDENYVRALRNVVTGAASDDEIQATVGWIVRKFQNHGADGPP